MSEFGPLGSCFRAFFRMGLGAFAAALADKDPQGGRGEGGRGP